MKARDYIRLTEAVKHLTMVNRELTKAIMLDDEESDEIISLKHEMLNTLEVVAEVLHTI